MENRINKKIIKEEPCTIHGNPFKKITFEDGEQIYKGFDKRFNIWVTLRFRQTDDSEVVKEIGDMVKYLIREGGI